MKITIPGSVPPKKNSKRRIKRGHKIFNVPSLLHQHWHTSASAIIAPLRPKTPFTSCEYISLRFFFADDRRRDLTNAAESVLDLLVDCYFLEDDRWQVTGPVLLYPVAIDRVSPRVEIVITLSKK